MHETAEVSPSPLKADVGRALRNLGFWPSLSIVILAFLLVSVTLRAGKQGITGDEAFNWALFLRGALRHVLLADYDASNHVLYTVLAWLSIHWLGLNEFNLRIPTLAAAALFFVTTHRISSLLFGKRPWHVVSTLILAGNPYVLDFFTVARGYGLALAFFSLALLTVLSVSNEDPVSPTRLFRTGVWAALSVCSNLTFLFPIIALFGAFAVALFHRTGRRLRDASRIASEFIRSSIGPFVVISFCVLVMPLRTATKASFYVGASTWPEMLDSLLRPSFSHNFRVPFLAKRPDLFWSLYTHFEREVIPLLALLIVVYALVCLFRRRQEDWTLVISSLTFTLAIFGLWCAHEFLGVKLPIMRTGMYLLFLLPLPLLALLSVPRRYPDWRIGLALSPIFFLIACCYMRQWTPRATWDWRYDAPTREFAKAIDILGIELGLHEIKVGGSWVFEPALNYYRQKNNYSNWLPVVRQKVTDPADFYVLAEEDRPAAAALKLRILINDLSSGSVLAAPERSCTK
jgi:hypothetical protein